MAVNQRFPYILKPTHPEDLTEKEKVAWAVVMERYVHPFIVSPPPEDQVFSDLSGWLLIGEGSTSLVFRAFDTHTEREVCIKLMKERLRGTKNYRFFRHEVKVLVTAAEQSPYLPTIFDVEEDLGFIVMQYIEGQPFDIFDQTHKPLFFELLKAVKDLHVHRFPHGDLKFSNILVGKNRPYLVDLGGSGTLGTKPFRAPEQELGNKPTMASDIYSLAIIHFLIQNPKTFPKVSGLRDSASVRGVVLESLNKAESIYEECLNLEPNKRPTIDDLIIVYGPKQVSSKIGFVIASVIAIIFIIIFLSYPPPNTIGRNSRVAQGQA